jgi:plasmid stability protein
VSAFVPQELREALEVSAREHDRSLSAELRVALRAYISPRT